MTQDHGQLDLFTEAAHPTPAHPLFCDICLRPEVQADGWCRKCGNWHRIVDGAIQPRDGHTIYALKDDRIFTVPPPGMTSVGEAP